VARRLVIGSAGFTAHVMDNKNFDLMVRIDYDGFNEYMMSLHKRTTASAEFKTAK
jgi:hypothetical protein